MSRERFMLRVEKGALVPNDASTRDRLREKGYRVGDILAATLVKPRNPQFYRLAHAFGRLVADNIAGFDGLSAHSVLKRIQLEGDIACDRMVLNLPGIGLVEQRQAQSLSFESMDEGQFREVYMRMCAYISERYWTNLTPEQIAEMAETMPEAA